MTRLRAASPYLLTGLLAGAGITHFVTPGFYDAIVPHVLPGAPRTWTYASGVAELAVAAAVAVPGTRNRGALAAAVLFVAVFPANLQMAVDADTASEKVIAYVRLPLQLPLIWWAFSVWRQTRRQVSAAGGRRGWRDPAR